MGYQLCIEVPLAATDSNKILGRNFHAKHAVFKKVKRDIEVLVYNKQPKAPLENFKISVTRYNSKTLDWDNFVASLKPFIDGLVLSKVIKDDSYQYIKSIETFQKISSEKKLVITVTEGLDDSKKNCSGGTITKEEA